jgi:sterol desaturase/sphingolipid hydroxylase (fatty acid hydroxylase superfamily)
MRRILRIAVFPLALIAGVGSTMLAIDRGVQPVAAMFGVYVAGMFVVTALERLMPFDREWNHSQGDLGADALYLPTTWLVGGLLQPASAALALALASWLSNTIGIGLWPTDWPLLAQVALASVVAEFFDYWAHRAMHESSWLWRFHAIHHSAPRLYWLNATRTHPGETLFRGFIGGLPLAILGVTAPVLAVWMVIGRVAGLFQHANIDFELRPFSWIFSIGALHRWHHSTRTQEANRNYGNTFIFWDSVFGTRFLPSDRTRPEAIGIDGLAAFPKSLPAQLLAPFRFRRIEEASGIAVD